MEGIPPVEHRADALFALPRLPSAVKVLGDPPGWRADLHELGIELAAEADVVVADDEHSEQALAAGAQFVVVDGSPGVDGRLRTAGLSTARLLSLPIDGSPLLFVDLASRRAAAYAIRHGIVHTEHWRNVRNRIAALLAYGGSLPGVRRAITVGTHDPGPPGLIAAAQHLGTVHGAHWVMFVSAGSVVRRNAFLLFEPGSLVPTQVLKFARVPGLALPFERDERGAELAARTGGAVAARAPAYFGRFRLDGYEGSLEAAAVGTKLANVLRRPGTRRAKLRAVERVAQWLIQVARETASPPEALTPERERLAREVVPAWAESGASADLLERLPPIPACFQHNDVAEDNVIVGPGGFTVLDWEWAQPHGLPLGDLVYFAVHVLRIVDGALTEEDRDRHFADVLSGRAPSSVVLFSWIRTLVTTLGLPPESAGPIVTLNWLDRGRLSRQERLRAESVGGAPLGLPFAERAASIWMTEPGLGPGWAAWRG